MAYDQDDLVTVEAIFEDTAGLKDPTVIKLHVKKPDAAITIYTHGIGSEIVRDSIGKYHSNVKVDQSGTWQFRWVADGEVVATKLDEFYVEASGF